MTTPSTTITHKTLEFTANDLTPVQIFKRLTGKNKFLLESACDYQPKGNYSFIGVQPYQTIIGDEDTTTVIDRHASSSTVYDQHILSYIKKQLPVIDIDIPLPFYGGAIGYIGYDAIRHFEPIGNDLVNDLEMPHSHLMVYQDVIVFNHAANTITLVTINVDEQPEFILDQRLKKLKKVFTSTPEEEEMSSTSIQFEPEQTKLQFLDQVSKAQQLINNGHVKQVVISQRFKGPITGDPLIFYEKLRRANPSPYMFYIDFSDYIILGSSPESLIQSVGTKVITNPIAGTRPRGKTPTEDQQLMDELRNDPKEVAEHDMLVELNKHELLRVCDQKSVTMPKHMAVEKYQHVMHLVTEIHGILTSPYTGIDALLACLPAGTVSGVPKKQAMQIINTLESHARGVYGGAVGYINFNGDLNMALAIRSLIIKNSVAYLQSGAGIVKDSRPEDEYEETLQKAKALMNVDK